uniref:Uncharacterized protein n=1 Tax=Salix viminalis TaxID=40686 RepID=A0A6N2K4I2_SALVM
MKSKLHVLESKLSETKSTISKLAEEKRQSCQETKILQKELDFLDEAGSEMHLENQICGTASGNDGRTETANVKEVELEVDEHPSATKTTKNTCSQKEETKEQEECGSGV